MSTGPRRPGSLIPFTPEPDDEPEAVRYNRRTRSVTDRDGNPLELRGDLGGEASTPPPGFQGMRFLRPNEIEQRYRAMLAEPVGPRFDEDGNPVGHSLHEELAAAPDVPLPIRAEAVERLNDAEGSERYLLEDGELRDRVREATDRRLGLADEEALERMGVSGTGLRRVVTESGKVDVADRIVLVAPVPSLEPSPTAPPLDTLDTIDLDDTSEAEPVHPTLAERAMVLFMAGTRWLPQRLRMWLYLQIIMRWVSL